MKHTAPFSSPSQLIAFLNEYGADPVALEAMDLKLPNAEERRLFHAFMVCWDDKVHAKRKHHHRKLKNALTRAQRRRINCARKIVAEKIGYSTKQNRHTFYFSAEESKDAQQLLTQTEEAIAKFKTTRQKISHVIGGIFGFIYALSNGANNGRAMASSIITICAILGISGLCLSAPYIVIPAVIVGLASLIINAALALKASGDNFAAFFGEGRPFESLFHYKDKNGNNIRFSFSQGVCFLFLGVIPACFSAFCKGVLAGFVVLLILSSGPLAAAAWPIAAAIMLSFTAALSIVYIKNSSLLFHFDKNTVGLDAVKQFCSRLLFPNNVIQECVEHRVKAIKQQLKQRDHYDKEEIDRHSRDYARRVERMARIISYVFIPLSVLGIALTLYASAIAAPVLFPFLTLAVSALIAGLALPGQIPFYNISAVLCATKCALALCKVPEALRVNSPADEAPKPTQGQSTWKTLCTSVKYYLGRAWHMLYEFSKLGNAFGNGAIAMASTDFFHPVADAILKPVTFILASFSSATMGYALDPTQSRCSVSARARYESLFKPQAKREKTEVKKIQKKITQKRRSKSSQNRKAKETGAVTAPLVLPK